MSEKEGSSRRDALKGAGALILGVAAAGVLSPEKVSAAKAEKRWAFVVDLRKCVGCRTCTIACKAEFDVPLGRWRAVIKDVNWGSFPAIRGSLSPGSAITARANPAKGCPRVWKNAQRQRAAKG